MNQSIQNFPEKEEILILKKNTNFYFHELIDALRRKQEEPLALASGRNHRLIVNFNFARLPAAEPRGTDPDVNSGEHSEVNARA